jgi:hypothetical protein
VNLNLVYQYFRSGQVQQIGVFAPPPARATRSSTQNTGVARGGYTYTMPFTPFADICPQIARRETRSLEVVGNSKIPDGTYTFYDNYCDNPYCDCKCVVIEVESVACPADILAVLTYGWESSEFYAASGVGEEHPKAHSGVLVDSDRKHHRHADMLREIFEDYVEHNPDYAAVLQSHYDAVKATVGLGATQDKRLLQKRRKLKRKQNG